MRIKIANHRFGVITTPVHLPLVVGKFRPSAPADLPPTHRRVGIASRHSHIRVVRSLPAELSDPITEKHWLRHKGHSQCSSVTCSVIGPNGDVVAVDKKNVEVYCLFVLPEQ